MRATASPRDVDARQTRRVRGKPFAKGNKLGGRTHGTKEVFTLLREEMTRQEATGALTCACACTTFRQHFLRRALANDTVLVTLMNKFYPNAEAPPVSPIDLSTHFHKTIIYQRVIPPPVVTPARD